MVNVDKLTEAQVRKALALIVHHLHQVSEAWDVDPLNADDCRNDSINSDDASELLEEAGLMRRRQMTLDEREALLGRCGIGRHLAADASVIELSPATQHLIENERASYSGTQYAASSSNTKAER